MTAKPCPAMSTLLLTILRFFWVLNTCIETVRGPNGQVNSNDKFINKEVASLNYFVCCISVLKLDNGLNEVRFDYLIFRLGFICFISMGRVECESYFKQQVSVEMCAGDAENNCQRLRQLTRTKRAENGRTSLFSRLVVWSEMQRYSLAHRFQQYQFGL